MKEKCKPKKKAFQLTHAQIIITLLILGFIYMHFYMCMYVKNRVEVTTVFRNQGLESLPPMS